MTRNLKLAACLSAMLLTSGGCSSGNSGENGAVLPAVAMDLREVGDILRTAKKPPTKAADVKALRGNYPRGYDQMESGEIVVVWGAGMAGEGDAASGTGPKGVIAYEKAAPESGGYVLRQDGHVEQLTAEQFKAAEKAK